MKFNEYEILHDAGKVSAEKEYKKFRVIQDKAFESDFIETFAIEVL